MPDDRERERSPAEAAVAASIPPGTTEVGIDIIKVARIRETLARFGLKGAFRQASLPGHLLCFSKRPDPAKPWLDAPRLVVAPSEV